MTTFIQFIKITYPYYIIDIKYETYKIFKFFISQYDFGISPL